MMNKIKHYFHVCKIYLYNEILYEINIKMIYFKYKLFNINSY